MELMVTCWEDSLKPGDQLGRRVHVRGRVGEAEGLHHGAHSSGGQRGRRLAEEVRMGKSSLSRQNQMTGKTMKPGKIREVGGRQASFRVTGHMD